MVTRKGLPGRGHYGSTSKWLTGCDHLKQSFSLVISIIGKDLQYCSEKDYIKLKWTRSEAEYDEQTNTNILLSQDQSLLTKKTEKFENVYSVILTVVLSYEIMD